MSTLTNEERDAKILNISREVNSVADEILKLLTESFLSYKDDERHLMASRAINRVHQIYFGTILGMSKDKIEELERKTSKNNEHTD